ncbi:protein SAMBA-like isoform X1 [Gastrolobium bilobum]|uniref:protein SAMBA-like n=1 Tax=Gastrolobium bilobum TaxID=150636 RepID=UPI002AB0C564|nr:protein SAMBA-like [Gastrolobium bilobum]XP_061363671.1 protein SAMBA-like isoform X1 [Gastrolobium bilobum]
MNSSSPAHSSISTTAVVGGGGGGGGGGSSNAAVSVDDFNFPCNPISTQERKDEAMRVLKSDLMAALDKEVKSLDDDNWKFEGPRSRIHLVSRRGGPPSSPISYGSSNQYSGEPSPRTISKYYREPSAKDATRCA